MAKKVYDIKPPKLAKKVEKDLKEFFEEEKKVVKRRRKPVAAKKQDRPAWVWISVAGAAALVLVCGVLFFKLPKADVEIWPKTEVLSFEQSITAEKSSTSVDIDESLMPVQYYEVSKTDSQEFQATGNASDEGKASGTITIYNKYDPPTSVTLKNGTHFMSDSGKLFIILQKVVIPAAKKSGSKITPGSVTVKVQAVEGGEGYNIAPSTFSVPGLKGTAYYYSISAESTKDMSGGYAGKIRKVTDDDIQGAKDAMVKKVSDQAKEELKSQIPQGYILIDDAISTKTSDASTATKSGTVAENFTYQATVKASGLAFKKSDLDQFAKDYIVSQMPEGQAMLDSSFKIDYSIESVDISGGKMVLNLTFSSSIYKNVDKNSLAVSLMGKSAGQMSEILKANMGDGLSDVKVKLWPFWVSKSPNSQKNVNIELKF